jgi:hypothetical protein
MKHQSHPIFGCSISPFVLDTYRKFLYHWLDSNRCIKIRKNRCILWHTHNRVNFVQYIYEIKASPIELLDLLIRYLGKSSSRQVSRIKTSNPGNPKLGLEKASTRIDTIYGSLAKIESRPETQYYFVSCMRSLYLSICSGYLQKILYQQMY